MKLNIFFKITLIILAFVIIQNSCEKNLYDSPDPGRLILHFKIDGDAFQNNIHSGDKLEILIQYVKGYVDSSVWAYIVDKDSLKVFNVLNIDNNNNILTSLQVDTVWIDSVNFQLDTVQTEKPVILCDNEGVYLPPKEYQFMKIKAVLEDTLMILKGKNVRIKRKPNSESIATVAIDINLSEDQLLERDLYFDLNESIEQSAAEPNLYYFEPLFYVK